MGGTSEKKHPVQYSIFYRTGCFFHWYPPKSSKYKKVIYARLGVSRPIYVNVDSPSLGFTYFNFLGGNQWKENTLYLNSVVNHLSCFSKNFSKVTTHQRKWEAMSNCLRDCQRSIFGFSSTLPTLPDSLCTSPSSCRAWNVKLVCGKSWQCSRK